MPREERVIKMRFGLEGFWEGLCTKVAKPFISVFVSIGTLLSIASPTSLLSELMQVQDRLSRGSLIPTLVGTPI